MPRPLQYVDHMVARFLANTFKRIDAVLGENEDRAGLVRAAVERELKIRERRAERKG